MKIGMMSYMFESSELGDGYSVFCWSSSRRVTSALSMRSGSASSSRVGCSHAPSSTVPRRLFCTW